MAARRPGPKPSTPRDANVVGPEADLGPEVRQLFGVLFCGSGQPDAKCARLDRLVARYRKAYLKPMREWLEKRRPKTLPDTVLYPFAGADLLSALSVFPEQRRFIHLALEHGGPPDPLRGAPAKRVAAARWQLLWMAGALLAHGESFSVDLQKQEQAGLPGVLPILLVGLRVHGGTPTGLSYLEVKPDGTVRRYTRQELTAGAPRARRLYVSWKDPRYSRRFSHLELRFRLPGDARDRVVRHFAANLANQGLARARGVAKHLEKIGPVALMIKASSYLLWTRDFSRIRELAFTPARFAIGDISLPYPGWLLKQGFKLETHGRYRCHPKPKLRSSAVPWVQLFRRPKSRLLPFRYGYRDCARNDHLVLLRRP